MKRVWQPRVAGLVAALAVVLTASAQADTGARSGQVTQRATESAPVATMARGRRCSDPLIYISKLRAYRITCRLARTAMNKWYDNDNCGLDDNCYIRIGRNGNLWSCWSYRVYGTTNLYYSGCYPVHARFTHSALWNFRKH